MFRHEYNTLLLPEIKLSFDSSLAINLLHSNGKWLQQIASSWYLQAFIILYLPLQLLLHSGWDGASGRSRYGRLCIQKHPSHYPISCQVSALPYGII